MTNDIVCLELELKMKTKLKLYSGLEMKLA